MCKLNKTELINAATLVDETNRILKERGSSLRLKVSTKFKNNLDCEAVIIKSSESDVVIPSLNMADFIDMYKASAIEEQSLNDLAEEIENLYEREIKDNKSFLEKNISGTMSKFSKEYILKNVKPKLISKENAVNASKNDIAYSEYLDMIVVYYVSVGETLDGQMTTTLKNYILEEYDISIEEIHQVALKNIKGDFKITTMFDVVMGITGLSDEEMEEEFGPVPEEDNMYIIRNSTALFGAAALLELDFLEEVSVKKFKSGDYIILPSSIHELIVVNRATDDENYENAIDELKIMVKEVNDGQVDPEDRLTYSIYKYSSKDKKVEVLL